MQSSYKKTTIPFSPASHFDCIDGPVDLQQNQGATHLAHKPRGASFTSGSGNRDLGSCRFKKSLASQVLELRCCSLFFADVQVHVSNDQDVSKRQVLVVKTFANHSPCPASLESGSGTSSPLTHGLILYPLNMGPSWDRELVCDCAPSRLPSLQSFLQLLLPSCVHLPL